jgi:ABC-2 type transport system permease protein
MLLMSPMFVWFVLVQDPNGKLAFWLSMFPPATSTTMVLRMATGVTIPLWQPLVGAVILVVSTAACVVLAGRIFRVGILWQGKTPRMTEIIRWAFSG